MKKTWKRLCALFLAVVMTLSLLPTAAFAADVSTRAVGELTIPGYTQVTELPGDPTANLSKAEDLGKYLIVAPYTYTPEGGDGPVTDYYMLYPGAPGGAAGDKNSARLKVENGKATGYWVGFGEEYGSAPEAMETNWTAAENNILIKEGANGYSVAGSSRCGYYVNAIGPDEAAYTLFSGADGNCYSAGKNGITAIYYYGDGYFRLHNAAHGSKPGLVFFSTNMNFSRALANTPACSYNMMLFKRNAEVGGHIAPLGKTLIEKGSIGNSEKWTASSDTLFTFDNSGENDSAKITGGTGANNTITWKDGALNWSSSVLVQFEILPPAAKTDQDSFKVRIMKNKDSNAAGNAKWLEIRFAFDNGKLGVEIANDSCYAVNSSDAISWGWEQGATGNAKAFQWEPGTTYPVDILLRDRKVSVYWNGSLILDEVEIPEANYGAMEPCALQFASQYGGQNHTISNLVVTTDPDPLPPEDPELPEYNATSIAAGWYDVGAVYSKNTTTNVWTVSYSNPSNGVANETKEDGSVTFPNGTVVEATAASWADHVSYNDRYPYFAVDGNAGNPVWHTRYTDSGQANPYGPTQNDLGSQPENRYLQLKIVDGQQWLGGLRYLPKSGNASGDITEYAIKVSNDGENWMTVATGSFSSRTTWQTVTFEPVQAQYVRLYGVATYGIGANNNAMSASEVRLVKWSTQEPTVVTNAFTVKSDKNTPAAALEGAVITIAGQTLTTDENGQATVRNLVAGQTYTAQVTYADHEGQAVTFVAAENGTSEVTLRAINRTITGKVVDEKNTPIEGATVTLMNDDAGFTTVTSVPADTTDENGIYTLNVNSVAAGNYKVRASMAGYDAVIGTAVTIVATEATETKASADVALTKIDVDSAKFKYDMTDSRPTLGFSTATDHPTSEYTDKGELKLHFTSQTRMNNLVTLTGTGVKNGTIEFDARREGAGTQGRFALALRLTDSDHWIYVGSEEQSGKWFWEYWNGYKGTTHLTGYLSTMPVGITFGNGDTRHFKVTINENKLSLAIDGQAIFNEVTLSTDIPMDARDVGFICGNRDTGVPCDIYIDNLYIFREDLTYTVTLPADTAAVKLTAEIKSSGEQNDQLGGTNHDQAAVGDVIVIKGKDIDTGKALAAVTVKESDPADGAEPKTVEVTQTDDGVFTFTMPDYDVTVEGTLAKSFDAKKPVTEDDPADEIAPKAGVEYKLVLTPTDADVTYEWYVEANAGEEDFEPVTIGDGTTGDNGRSFTPSKDIAGKALKVVVTGNFDADDAENTYAGIKTLVTKPVAPADVNVESVSIARDSLIMWTNDESKDTNDDDHEMGKTVVLTATVGPEGVNVPYYLEWKSSAKGKVTVVKKADDQTKATVTAVASTLTTGPVTVTVTAYSDEACTQVLKTTVTENGESKEVDVKDTILITVKTKPEGLKVYDGKPGEEGTVEVKDDAPLVLYSNTEDELKNLEDSGTVSRKNNANLTFQVEPDGASTENKSWNTRSDDTTYGQHDYTWLTVNADRTTPGDNIFTVTPGKDNIGEVTFTTYYGGTPGDISETGGAAKLGSFRVVVLRHLVFPLNIDVKNGAEPRVGATLIANLDGGSFKDEAAKGMVFTWYRTTIRVDAEGNETKGDPENIQEKIGREGAEYTLTEADIGAEIHVTITATPKYNGYKGATDVAKADAYYYEGTLTADPITVLKNVCDKVPELDAKSASDESAADGAITIKNLDSDEKYEYRAEINVDEDGNPVWDETWTEIEVEANEDGNLVIENLKAGNYQVRVMEGDKHDAGEPVIVTVEDGTTYYNVTVRENDGTKGTAVSPSRVKEGSNVTLTVTPIVGYEVESVTYTVTPKTEGGDVKPDPEPDPEPEPDPATQADEEGETEPGTGEDEEKPGTEGGDDWAPQGTALTGTPGRNGAMTYTVPGTAVRGDVTFYVTYKEIELTIEHVFDTHLKCDLSDDMAAKHTVKYGEVTSITLKLVHEEKDGFGLPDSVTVEAQTGTAADGTPAWAEIKSFDYDSKTGEISFPGGVTRNLKITANAKQIAYRVVGQVSTQLTLTPKNAQAGMFADANAAFEATLEVYETYTSGWVLPETITVIMGRDTLTAGEGEEGEEGDYTYNSTTGAITVKNVTGDVFIIANAAVRTIDVTGVKINISHVDPNTTQANTPHEDDTLTATVTPAAASVTYKWVRVDGTTETELATTPSYKVTADDVGKTIKLTVTGAGSYKGTPSDETVTVGERTIPTTGVTLDSTRKTVSVGETFTLTATVLPELPKPASNQTVTWKVIGSNNEDITDTNDVVTLSAKEGKTITVTAKGAGNVRVRAINAGGQTAACDVVVERANEYTLNYYIVNDTEKTVTVKYTTGGTSPTELANEGKVLAGTLITVTATNLDATVIGNLNVVTADGQPVSVTKNSDTTWQFAMPAGNVYARFSVTAAPPVVERVTLSQTTANAYVGDTFGLMAHVEPDGADYRVTWTSDNEDVATVTNGTVRCLTAGTAKIKATSDADSSKFAECTVTVSPVDKQTLIDTITNATTAKTGVEPSDETDPANVDNGTRFTTQTAIDTLTAAIAAAETVKNNASATQAQVNNAVATLNRAIVAFNATVQTGTKEIVVRVPVTGITITGDTEVKIGKTITLTATVSPDTATNKGVTWTSSDSTKATVNNAGVVTGVGVGDVTITATSEDDSNITATYTVHVSPVLVETLTMVDHIEIEVGEDYLLTVSMTPSDATNQTLTWTSSNAAVTVTNGVIHGVSVTTEPVTITATTTDDSNLTATCRVTVVAQSEARLSSLTLSANDTPVALNPAFSNGAVRYTANVANTVESITVAATGEDGGTVAYAKITEDEDGGRVVTNCAGGVVSLDVGANVIEVTVSKTGLEDRVYTVTVTRAPREKAKLDGLTLSNGTLTPAFGAGILEYTASVGNSVNTVTVTATPEAGGTVIVEKVTEDTNGDPVRTPCAGGEVTNLAEGENVIEITVSNTGKDSQTYTVTITRLALKSIRASAAEFTGPYDGDPHSITVTVTDPTEHYEVRYQADTNTGSYSADNPSYTNVGQHTVYYRITADGYIPMVGNAVVTITKAQSWPAPEGLTARQCQSEDDNDGSITGLDPEQIYQYSKDNGVTWIDVPAGSTSIDGLEDGDYLVRLADDGNHVASGNTSVRIEPHNAVTYEITKVTPAANGDFTVSHATAKENDVVTITLAPASGCRLKENGLKVAKADGTGAVTTTKVDDTHYTFSMPAYAVTVTAEFEEIPAATYGVTVTVTNGTGSTTASVNEGESYTVTVRANSNYELPNTITVTMGGQTLESGYTYNKATGEITITSVTGEVTITVTCTAVSTPTPPSGGYVPVTPPAPTTTTETKENEDGTTTTIVTDNRTGTVTETTEKEDGTVEVVETKKDGTVTETTTDPEGGKVEKVTTPEKDVTITVTDAEGEVLAEVELPAEIPAVETRFVDVPEGHWADKAIHNMAALEVVNGVGNDRYDMNSSMTRGALATVLSRLSHGQEGLKSSFADVDSGKWYADGIAWAAKTGVVTGYSATEFGPEDVITREQLAVMLCRYARLLGMDTTADSAALDSFTDGSATHGWALDSIAWCVENGILNGMGNGTLAPTATATRAQVAVMLQRFIDLMK